MAALRVLSGCLLVALVSASSRGQAEVTANPIRKVVNMLQAMQKKITAEGEKEKELFEKFNCYCKNGEGELSASIAAAETKIPQVTSDIEAGENEVKQLK